MRYLLLTAFAMCIALSGVYGARSASAQVGETVGALSDLVGAKAGQAENLVNQRGYTWVKTDKRGVASYSYWTESGSGKCVVIRTEDGRYKSIIYTPLADCENGSSTTAAVIPAAVEGQCKLYNNKSNKYKYQGSCKIKRDTSGDGNIYDITLGNGDLYHFVEQGGKYKVQTPEGWSDHRATMSTNGNKTVFDWYKWELTVRENE